MNRSSGTKFLIPSTQIGEDMNRYLTEFTGTFFLVFTIGCSVLVGTPMAPLAIGASLMVMVLHGRAYLRRALQPGGLTRPRPSRIVRGERAWRVCVPRSSSARSPRASPSVP